MAVTDSTFKYGDLVVECAQCGNVDTIDTYISTGIDVMLFNNPESFFRVKCTSCGSELTVRLIPSSNVDEDIIEEEIKHEEFPQETHTEETI